MGNDIQNSGDSSFQYRLSQTASVVVVGKAERLGFGHVVQVALQLFGAPCFQPELPGSLFDSLLLGYFFYLFSSEPPVERGTVRSGDYHIISFSSINIQN